MERWISPDARQQTEIYGRSYLVEQAAETQTDQPLLSDLRLLASNTWYYKLVHETQKGCIILQGLWCGRM